MKEENQVESLFENSILPVIEAEDLEISKGKVGFLTNKMTGFFIDKFSYVPLNCINNPSLPDIRYLPPNSNRFRESYFGNFNMR